MEVLTDVLHSKGTAADSVCRLISILLIASSQSQLEGGREGEGGRRKGGRDGGSGGEREGGRVGRREGGSVSVSVSYLIDEVHGHTTGMGKKRKLDERERERERERQNRDRQRESIIHSHLPDFHLFGLPVVRVLSSNRIHSSLQPPRGLVLLPVLLALDLGGWVEHHVLYGALDVLSPGSQPGHLGGREGGRERGREGDG